MKTHQMKLSNDTGLLVLRLSVGVLMLLHGIFKLLHGPGDIEKIVESAHLPTFVAYGVYIGEIIAPLLIIVGFRTRLAALVFSFNCLVATLLTNTGDVFALTEQGGWKVELLGLYFFGALTLVFTGAGKFSVSTKSIFD